MEKTTEHCENLDRKIEDFKLQKSNIQTNYAPNKNKNNVRDEVLCELSSLWKILCCVQLKQHNSATYFDLFKILSKEDASLLNVLFKCLNCDDHFIAFQCHKILIEVYKCYPNLVLEVQFDELIDLSLSDRRCGRWLPIYAAEIIKALFLKLDCSSASNFHEKSFHHQCVSKDENKKQICPMDIINCLSHHWLKMTNHFLVELSGLVVNQRTLLPENTQESRFDAFQQILLTMLSYGKTFIQSCDCLLANQPIPGVSTFENASQEMSANSKAAVNYVSTGLPKSDECPKKSKHARICENESFTVSRLHLSCYICKKAIFKDDGISQILKCDVDCCTMDFEPNLFEEIVKQLVKIDHKRCLLHLSRTIFHFLDDAVSCISEQYFNHESKRKSSQDGIVLSVGVCSILIANINRLLVNIPQVIGKVHFGGQNCSCEQEEYDICGRSYDDVTLRKVLLLVLKSILLHFLVQNGHSKVIQWQALKEPLECWLNFVTHTAHSEANLVAPWLVQMFCEQDDELVYLLFSLLQLYQGLFCCESSQPVPTWTYQICNFLNPHGFFMEFLSSVNYDHSLLLDFLISSETHFLPYFLNYLRHMANDWHGFIETVEQTQALSREESPQSLGDMKVLKVKCAGCSNFTSKQLHRTEFSDDDSIGEDGDDIYGGLHNGNDEGGREEGDDGLSYSGNGNICDKDDVDSEESCFIEFDGNAHGKDSRVGPCEVVGHSYGVGSDGHGYIIDSCGYDIALGVGEGGGVNHNYGCDGDGQCYGSDGGCIKDGSGDGKNGDLDRVSGDKYKGIVDEVEGDYDNSGDYHYSTHVCGNIGIDDHSDINYQHAQLRTGHDSEKNTSSPMAFFETSRLEQSLSCLIRLRFAIDRMTSKDLFPYPVTALVKIMKYIETLFEEER